MPSSAAIPAEENADLDKTRSHVHGIIFRSVEPARHSSCAFMLLQHLVLSLNGRHAFMACIAEFGTCGFREEALLARAAKHASECEGMIRLTTIQVSAKHVISGIRKEQKYYGPY